MFRLSAILIVIVAQFAAAQYSVQLQNAIQPMTPGANWAFQWNKFGSISNPANYENLIATNDATFMYTADGTTGLNSQPGGPVFLGKPTGVSGGHPGLSDLNSGSGGISRWAIAKYTMPQDGFVNITGGMLSNLAPGDGVNYRISLNDNSASLLSGITSGGTGSSTTFSYNFGALTTGDRIYVAISNGNLGNISNDTFALNYTINVSPIPEPGLLCLLAIGGSIALRRRSAL